MIDAKLHKDGVLSICDTDLIGKAFSEDGVEVKVAEYFYKGEHWSEEKLETFARNTMNINAIGKESVALLLKLNIIEKENIRMVEGIPMAMVFQV